MNLGNSKIYTCKDFPRSSPMEWLKKKKKTKQINQTINSNQAKKNQTKELQKKKIKHTNQNPVPQIDHYKSTSTAPIITEFKPIKEFIPKNPSNHQTSTTKPLMSPPQDPHFTTTNKTPHPEKPWQNPDPWLSSVPHQRVTCQVPMQPHS